jgi:L-cysteine desulfidase
MKELVSAIENGLKKITKGNITLIELEETVASSRELYERLLIVRYKVYENSILSNEESEELKVVDKQTEGKKEEKTIPEENKDIEIIFEEETNDIAEDSVIRFDLFDTPEIEPSIEEEEVLPEIEIKEEELVEENLDSEEEIENTVNDSAETSKEITENASELFPKLMKIEKSIAQNYQVMTLETLIGSFTLNERLQFINELFDGSSDLFSSAIKRLDALDNRDSARSVIAEYAAENNWDLDGEVVEDFMLKICSRYAANLGN